MRVFCLRVCRCTVYACSAQRGQKRASEAMDLELQTALTFLWLLGIKRGSSERAVSVLNLGAISLAPNLISNLEISTLRFFFFFFFVLGGTGGVGGGVGV